MNGYGTSPLELLACEAELQGIAFLDEFTYSARFLVNTATALGALGTNQVQIQINQDSDFVFQEQNITCFDHTPTYVDDPNMLISMVRAGSGREVMNQDQHVLNVMGSYARNKVPGRKAMPGLIQANSTLTIKLTDLQNEAWSQIDVALIGFKVFYIQNPATGQVGDRRTVFHVL